MPKLELIEDEISRKLAEAERTGELRSAPSFGKPLAADAGWDMTPDELKMPFKVLKNAGIVPPEVELFHERARLREALQSASDEGQSRALRKQLTELERRLSLRLEALQRSGAEALQPRSDALLNGFSTSTPKGLKSATLRVTTVRLCTRAVAAIIASSYTVSERLCISFAHVRKVVASIGRTLYVLETRSSHASISTAFASS